MTDSPTFSPVFFSEASQKHLRQDVAKHSGQILEIKDSMIYTGTPLWVVESSQVHAQPLLPPVVHSYILNFWSKSIG